MSCSCCGGGGRFTPVASRINLAASTALHTIHSLGQKQESPAHTEALTSSLRNIYHNRLESVEEFIPQLCYCFLHQQDPNLHNFILRRCADSTHFALHLFFFLFGALSDTNGKLAASSAKAGGNEESQKLASRIENMLEQVAKAAVLRSSVKENGVVEANYFIQLLKNHPNQLNFLSFAAQEWKGPAAFEIPRHLGPRVALRFSFFVGELEFVWSLSEVAEQLRNQPDRSQRAELLRTLLTALDARLQRDFPMAFIPLGYSSDHYRRVIRIPSSEAKVFSTHARCPYMIFLEVISSSTSLAHPLLKPRHELVSDVENRLLGMKEKVGGGVMEMKGKVEHGVHGGVEGLKRTISNHLRSASIGGGGEQQQQQQQQQQDGNNNNNNNAPNSNNQQQPDLNTYGYDDDDDNASQSSEGSIVGDSASQIQLSQFEVVGGVVQRVSPLSHAIGNAAPPPTSWQTGKVGEEEGGGGKQKAQQQKEQQQQRAPPGSQSMPQHASSADGFASPAQGPPPPPPSSASASAPSNRARAYLADEGQQNNNNNIPDPARSRSNGNNNNNEGGGGDDGIEMNDLHISVKDAPIPEDSAVAVGYGGGGGGERHNNSNSNSQDQLIGENGGGAVGGGGGGQEGGYGGVGLPLGSHSARVRKMSVEEQREELREANITLEALKQAGGGGGSSSMHMQSKVFQEENWESKKERIRKASPFGKLKGWDLQCVMVKSFDDLRQECFAMQLFQLSRTIFQSANLPLFLHPYHILSTSQSTGLIEGILDCISLDALKKSEGYVDLLTHFKKCYGDPSTPSFQQAQTNYVSSLAAYSAVCHVFAIKDRHNGNVMIDRFGHIIHIDFGFFLSGGPGGITFESAPFKLTKEMARVIGKRRSAAFARFVDLFTEAIIAMRRRGDEIILVCEMMFNAVGDSFQCFKRGKQVLADIHKRLGMDLSTEAEVRKMCQGLVNASYNAFRTRQYDLFQKMQNGIVP